MKFEACWRQEALWGEGARRVLSLSLCGLGVGLAAAVILSLRSQVEDIQ